MISEEDATKLLKKYSKDKEGFDKVLEHSKAVQKAALSIAKDIHGVDINLIKIGALLHDIGRFDGKKQNHGIIGAEILRKEGLDENIVLIAERHVGAGISKQDIEEQNLELPKKDLLPKSKEEKIICHADNLVFGTRIGNFKEVYERFEKEIGKNVAERALRLKEDIEKMSIDLLKMKKEQLKLANNIILRDEFKKIKLLAGCDCAFDENKIAAAVVVIDYKTLELVETKIHMDDLKFPYKPDFMFYREGPAIIEAFNKLEKKPDVLLCDFNGILHPRRIGAASQLGLVLDMPTVGVAKSLRMGEVEDGKIMVGNEMRGIKVITREHAKPLFVSPGHKISFGTSVDIIKRTIKYPHKLPEPLHIAHKISKKALNRSEPKD